MIDTGQWKWPDEWASQFPILSTIPILYNDIKDKAKWVSNDVKVYDLTIQNAI